MIITFTSWFFEDFFLIKLSCYSNKLECTCGLGSYRPQYSSEDKKIWFVANFDIWMKSIFVFFPKYDMNDLCRPTSWAKWVKNLCSHITDITELNASHITDISLLYWKAIKVNARLCCLVKSSYEMLAFHGSLLLYHIVWHLRYWLVSMREFVFKRNVSSNKNLGFNSQNQPLSWMIYLN